MNEDSPPLVLQHQLDAAMSEMKKINQTNKIRIMPHYFTPTSLRIAPPTYARLLADIIHTLPWVAQTGPQRESSHSTNSAGSNIILCCIEIHCDHCCVEVASPNDGTVAMLIVISGGCIHPLL